MLDFINKKRSNRASAQVSANQTQKPLKSSRISVKYIITETKTIPVLLAMMFIVALIPIVSNIKRQQSTNAAPNQATWNFAHLDHYRYNATEIDITPNSAKLAVLPTSFRLTADEADINDAFRVYDPTRTSIVTDPQNPNNKVYKFKGSGGGYHILTTKYLPINHNFTYQVTGKIKSAKPGLLGRLDLAMWAKSGVDESPHWRQKTRYGDVATITNVTDREIAVTGANLTTWGNSDIGWNRSVMLYYNGYTGGLPDAILECRASGYATLSEGFFAVAENNKIHTNCKMPDEVKNRIRPGVTQITGVVGQAPTSHMTTAFPNSDTTWVPFSASITGTLNDRVNNNDKFEIGTRRTHIDFTVNGGLDDRYETLIDDIEVRVIGAQPTYSWAAPVIHSAYPHHFDGKALSFTNTLGANTTEQEVRYQISINNGQTWLWWNGTNWAEVNHTRILQGDDPAGIATAILPDVTFPETQANPASVINTNLNSLTSTGGDFRWRAFLVSNGSKQVELREVSFSGELVPSAPQNLTATQITQPHPTIPSATDSLNQVRLNWKRPANEGSSQLTSYHLYYKLSGQPDNQYVEVSGTNTLSTTATDLTFTVSNLTYKANYDFRLVATNQAGTSQAALVQNVNIKDTTAPVLHGVQETTVNQNATFDPLAGVTAVDNVDGNITNISVYGDTVNTAQVASYTVVYFVQDSSGNRTIINRRVTVLSQTPTSPQNLTASQSGTTNSIQVSWQVPATVNGPLRGYQLEYKRHQDTAWQVYNNSDTTPLTQTSATLSGLTFGQFYDIQVRAINNIGPSTPAIVQNILVRDQTAPTIQGATNLTIDFASSFDPMQGVTATDDQDGTITNRIFYTGTVNTHALGNYLIVYHVQDSANNLAVASRTITVTQTVTPSPTSLQANQVQHSKQLNLTWQAPVHNGGSPITGYRIAYKPSNQTNWTTIPQLVNDTHYVLNNLEYGVEYDIQIRAVNAVGQSNPVQIQARLTPPPTPPTPPSTPPAHHHTSPQPANTSIATGLPNSGYGPQDNKIFIVIVAIVVAGLTTGAVIFIKKKHRK